MSPETAGTFFALLTLAGNAAVVGVVLVAVAARRSPAARTALDRLRRELAPWAVPFAFLIAAGAMAGSLYYSEHVGFEPCTLCWYQRTAIYPVVLILGVAWWRRDGVAPLRYAMPLTVIAGLISGYHYLIQQFPSLEAGFCSADVPCSAPYLDEFGFVSLAYMGASTAALIVAVLVVGKQPPGGTIVAKSPSRPDEALRP